VYPLCKEANQKILEHDHMTCNQIFANTNEYDISLTPKHIYLSILTLTGTVSMEQHPLLYQMVPMQWVRHA